MACLHVQGTNMKAMYVLSIYALLKFPQLGVRPKKNYFWQKLAYSTDCQETTKKIRGIKITSK